MAVLVLSATAISGCSTLSPDLRNAATTLGQARASIVLPSLPARCSTPTPHAALRLGDNAVAVLDRERHQLNKANGDKTDCAGFYNGLKAKLQSRP